MSPDQREYDEFDRLSARINQGGSAGLVDEQARLGSYGTAQAPLGIDEGHPGGEPDPEKPMAKKGLQAWEQAVGRDEG